MATTRKQLSTLIAAAAAAALTLTACAGQPPEQATPTNGTGTTATARSAEDNGEFDLDALIAAAQNEGPITIYDNASAVKVMAEAFQEKYGIEATGVKVDSSEQLEIVQREAESGNVVGDVIAIPDIPALNNQLIPNGFVTNWIPNDLKDNIPPSMQEPLVLIHDPNVWTYNDSAYAEQPVSNMWELTNEEWRGRVAMEDPVGSNKLLDWFSQMAQFGENELVTAYEDLYGEPFVTEYDTAAHEWVARMAANDPILTSSNEDVSAAVGQPGQENPPIGLMASSKYRNIEEKGYAHAPLENLNPWTGWVSPKAIVISSNTASPNAAKLFVHFALTEEGIAPQINDGKISSNSDIEQPEDPSNMRRHAEDMFYSDNAGVDADWASRQDWQDFWRIHS